MTLPDTTLGPYVLERELGRGVFGIVYRGHHEDHPDTLLAIKSIEAHGDLDRMLVEPALLARLSHPCVVGLREYFVRDGKLVLAMEYIPGEDLKAFIDRGESLPPERVRELLVQIGSALAAAHAQQIVHRDLKPSNILLDPSGGRTRFVLTDFGVGRTAEGVQAEKHVGGTYLYMAPEQLRGRPGAQSDLWALGVVAYQLLTGKLPFPGPTLDELAKQIQYTDPPPPSEVTGTPLPEDLETAVLGLLKKSLSERTGSATELLRQLGMRGDTKLLPDTLSDAKRSAVKNTVPFSKALDRRVRRATWLLGAMILIYVLENTVIQALVFMAGLWLFYYAQSGERTRRRRLALTVAAFAVLSIRFLPALVPEVGDVMSLGLNQHATTFADKLKAATTPPTKKDGGDEPKVATASPSKKAGPAGGTVPASKPDPDARLLAQLFVVVVMVFSILTLFVPVVAAAAYARVRRARREQALLKAALAGRTGSDEFLTLMKNLLDTRFEDVGFHLRYAEMLYARGDHRQAAVEARLITVQDPYHFNANLLLANAYYALRLYDDCRRVCDDYLAVSGYCFEFQELRQLCTRRTARP